MKFGKVGPVGPIGKATLVSAIALLVATLFTACGTLTVGFLFVTTNKQTQGQIEVYEVNSQSGVLRQIPTSPFPSGGRNPVAEAVSHDAKNLYVVNKDDNNIVQFGIGTDGKVYPQSTTNTPGSFPVAVAVNAAGTFLYVIDSLQPIAGCSHANPCPGDLAVYPINANGSLGTPVANNAQYPNYWPLLLSPTDGKTILTANAVNVLTNGNNVYVSAYNAATNAGYLFAFSSSSTGALTPLSSAPLNVGSQPVAMTSDAASSYLYVADKLQNHVLTYAVSGGTPTLQATASTGNQPSALTLDGTGLLYVTNSLDGNVTGYSVSSGNLTSISTNAVDPDPIAISVDPRQIGYLYTVNFLGNTLSGFQVNGTTGTLINTQSSPYVSTDQPTAIVGVPHGGTAK